VNILELGVAAGASMLIWRDYLPEATIVGVDLAAEAPASISHEPHLHYVSGSQDDPDVIHRAVAHFDGPIDLIIDDCAHIGRFAKRSFVQLFQHLRGGGYYVIEDICASFLIQHRAFDDAETFTTRRSSTPI